MRVVAAVRLLVYPANSAFGVEKLGLKIVWYGGNGIPQWDRDHIGAPKRLSGDVLE